MDKREKIEQLKKEKDAVILAHYYTEPEVQQVADYIGDSYKLSKVAVDLPQKRIVFCGVSFMGESAKLLNPKKQVLMPDSKADCPMAHMVKKEFVDQIRKEYDDLAVVCYINSTAEIKSWSDVCVTSANAVKIVRELPNKNILFIPDKNLAHFVAEQVPDKNFIYNEGYCPVHEFMIPEEIKELKKIHPEAKILVHPECCSDIVKVADYVGSTTGIIQFAASDTGKEYIIGTECGVLYELQQKREDAQFYFAKTKPVCEDMKKVTLDNIIDVMENETEPVELPEKTIAENAGKTLVRMLELAGK